MSDDNNLSPEDKLNYIYEYVKKEEKKNKHKLIFKWSFRFLIMLYLLYVYFYLWPILKNSYKTIIPFTNINNSWTQNAEWINIWWVNLDSEMINKLLNK